MDKESASVWKTLIVCTSALIGLGIVKGPKYFKRINAAEEKKENDDK